MKQVAVRSRILDPSGSIDARALVPRCGQDVTLSGVSSQFALWLFDRLAAESSGGSIAVDRVELSTKYLVLADTGEQLVVSEYQTFAKIGDKNGFGWVPREKLLKLADGSAVKCIDAETFEVLQSGSLLRRLRLQDAVPIEARPVVETTD